MKEDGREDGRDEEGGEKLEGSLRRVFITRENDRQGGNGEGREGKVRLEGGVWEG